VIDTYDFGSQFRRQISDHVIQAMRDKDGEGLRPDTAALPAEDLAVSALICQAFGPQKAADVAWCGEALKALKTRPEVAELVAGGGYDVSVDGNTVTVRAPNGQKTISTYDP
jgi:hypothetical protein